MMAVVRDLAQGLARRPDVVVGVAAARVGVTAGVEPDGPVTVYRVPIPGRTRLDGHRRLRLALLAQAGRFHPDLIHAHGSGYNGAAALDGAWPSVLTVHGVVRHEAAISGAFSLKERLAWRYDALLEARVLRRARHCIAISPYVRQTFAGYRHVAWHDIDNPVDDACFTLAPQPEPGRLLCPARIIPRKGIDILIRAFVQVAPRYPNAHLRLAGETTSAPAYVDACRQLVAAAGLQNRVAFLGNLSRADLLAEYVQAQALVLAAHQETAPVVVAEAMAAGLPVAATAVGGLPYQVEQERTGLLVPPDDVPALAVALTRLLSDPGQSRAWGAAGRQAAQHFRLDAVVEKTLAVYEVCSGRLSVSLRRSKRTAVNTTNDPRTAARSLAPPRGYGRRFVPRPDGE